MHRRWHALKLRYFGERWVSTHCFLLEYVQEEKQGTHVQCHQLKEEVALRFI